MDKLKYRMIIQWSDTEAEIRQYAKTCRIKQLVWIEADENPRRNFFLLILWMNPSQIVTS